MPDINHVSLKLFVPTPSHSLNMKLNFVISMLPYTPRSTDAKAFSNLSALNIQKENTVQKLSFNLYTAKIIINNNNEVLEHPFSTEPMGCVTNKKEANNWIYQGICAQRDMSEREEAPCLLNPQYMHIS